MGLTRLLYILVKQWLQRRAIARAFAETSLVDELKAFGRNGGRKSGLAVYIWNVMSESRQANDESSSETVYMLILMPLPP